MSGEIEENVSPELAAEFAAFQKEEAENAPPEAEVEQPLETNSEAPAPVEANNETPAPVEAEEVNDPFLFTVKGEEKSFSKDQINNMLNREETFQKKNNEILNSDAYKMSLLIAEAKGGNSQAQKKMKEMLGEMTNIDELDEVEGSFDVEKNHEEKMQQLAADEPFADVKDEVDFQETLDKMQANFGKLMPSNVFQDYWDDPASRRVMYDLERSGRAPELFKAFSEEVAGLSSLDRAKVNSDSTLYGNLFVEVLKSQDAKQVSNQSGVVENSDLDAVSAGDGSHSVKQSDPEPDYDSLTGPEWEAYANKLLKNAPAHG